VVVRQYRAGSSGVSFSVKSGKRVRITTAEFDNGPLFLKIDDRPAERLRVTRGAASFDVSAGEHTVELARDR
jgi:hypothetical protein